MVLERGAPQRGKGPLLNWTLYGTAEAVLLQQLDALVQRPRPPSGRRGDELEARGEGQQGDGAGLFDGARQLALEGRAGAGEAAWNDLAAVGDELLQQAHVAIADVVNLFDGELADLLAAEELAAARAAAGTACGTGRTSAAFGARDGSRRRRGGQSRCEERRWKE